jgi:hypothetical protein
MHPRTVGRSTPASGYLFTALAIGGVWLSVVLASIFAPAMVTGPSTIVFPLPHLRTGSSARWRPVRRLRRREGGFRRPQPAEDESTTLGVRTAAALSQQAAADDAAAKLGQLPALRAAGAITDEEFEAKKRELLSRI